MNANGLYSGLDGGAVNGVYNGVNSGVGNGAVSNEISRKLLISNLFPIVEAGYSLRKLSVNYNGAAIRVRRSSDNTEQDILFDENGNLNEGQLTRFVGVGSGFVSVWYDQSGRGRNAVQETTDSQPRIMLNGSIDRLGARPTLFFDGSNDFMTAASFNNNAVSIYTVFARTGGSQLGLVLLRKGLTTNISFEYVLRNTNPGNFFEGLASTGLSSSAVNTNPSTVGGVSGQPPVIKLGIFIFDNTNIKIALNNDNLSTATLSGTLFQGTAPLVIGARPANDAGTTFADYWSGRISEIILYGTSKSNDDTTIKSNINNYYKIY